MRQNPPIKPARETTKIKTPKTMTGHCRSLTQELSGSVASQTPAPMAGIERRMATKLMAPMTLLLSAIFLYIDLPVFCFGYYRNIDYEMKFT